MAERFSGVDALQIAIEMEKRGIELYKRAARLSASDEAIKLFNRLEADEREHRDSFARLRDSRVKTPDDAFSYAGEAGEYLSALASQVVFTDGLVGLGRDDGFDDPGGILKHAIDAERDSILFYEALLDDADENAGLFGEIIAQEKEHLIELTQMLSSIREDLS